MPVAAPAPSESLPLRDACVIAAQEVIAERGIEALSLRDVARRLGVSHQAPYRHYPSRDHLLAEVMRRSFERFARHLDARPPCEDPQADLAGLGRQYLQFAEAHPLEYRLMFSTPWPGAADHPDLLRDALHAFGVLRRVMRRLHGGEPETPHERADLDALYIWSAMHGAVGVMHGSFMGRLDLSPAVRAQAMDHVMSMVDRSLSAPR